MLMTPMAILPFRTKSYASQIYLQGSQRFTERDGYSGIPIEYRTPVKQYVGENPAYTDSIIAYALEQTWLLQQEYDDTMAYR